MFMENEILFFLEKDYLFKRHIYTQRDRHGHRDIPFTGAVPKLLQQLMLLKATWVKAAGFSYVLVKTAWVSRDWSRLLRSSMGCSRLPRSPVTGLGCWGLPWVALGCLGLPCRWQGSQHSGSLPLLPQDHQQESILKMDPLGLEPVDIQGVSLTGDNLAH